MPVAILSLQFLSLSLSLFIPTTNPKTGPNHPAVKEQPVGKLGQERTTNRKHTGLGRIPEHLTQGGPPGGFRVELHQVQPHTWNLTVAAHFLSFKRVLSKGLITSMEPGQGWVQSQGWMDGQNPPDGDRTQRTQMVAAMATTATRRRPCSRVPPN